jgi:hypothetical protein
MKQLPTLPQQLRFASSEDLPTVTATEQAGNARGTQIGVTIKWRLAALSSRIISIANGLAQAWVTLGKQSGPGSESVKASADGIAEEVVFIATAAKAPPHFIPPDLGINQYVASGSQPLEPLAPVVTDAFENRIANASVVFRVVAGQTLFDNGTPSSRVRRQSEAESGLIR